MRHRKRALSLLALLSLAGCGDDGGTPTTPEPSPSAPAPQPPAEPPPPEPHEEADTLAPAEPDEPTRQPPGPLAPALESVRWGPDRREPFEDLEALNAIAREHFTDSHVSVAGRLRARHGRERLTLAAVVTVKRSDLEEGQEAAEALRFTGSPAADMDHPEPMPENPAPCTCGGETPITLQLMRVLHRGDETDVAHVTLRADDFCSGTGLEMALADYDRDGRVEMRLDVASEGWLSCTANRLRRTDLFVVDIADLALQTSLLVEQLYDGYYDTHYQTGRVRFVDLDDDGDKDIEVRGTTEIREDLASDPVRDARRQTLFYDPATDRWEPAE